MAQRAGVTPPAIYRRWPNRIALIEQCVVPGLSHVDIPPTGDLDADLRRFVSAYQGAFAETSLRNALPGLLTAHHLAPGRHVPAEHGYGSARPQFRAILAAAPPGAVDPALDPDDLFDLLVGAILFRIFMVSLGIRAETQDHTIELLLRTLRPAADPQTPQPQGATT